MWSLLALLLLAGGPASAHVSRRKHVFISTTKSWRDAQQYCRVHYEDLSTIESDQENAEFLKTAVQSGWIGLRYNDSMQQWLWSDGDTSNYRDWDILQPSWGNGRCVMDIKAPFHWCNVQCDYNQPFFCYQWQMELVVVAENKTWEDALVHCRSFYTDLASLLTAAELTLAKNRSAPAQAARVWTSLRFLAGEWLWVDQGPPGARADPGDVPLPPCPARTDRCGARNLAAGVWESRDCQERLSFICYRNI